MLHVSKRPPFKDVLHLLRPSTLELYVIRVYQYNMFTGWCDCPLSTEGMEEAVDAGRLLAAAGLQVRLFSC